MPMSSSLLGTRARNEDNNVWLSEQPATGTTPGSTHTRDNNRLPASMNQLFQTTASPQATVFSNNGTLSQAAGSERMSLTVTDVHQNDSLLGYDFFYNPEKLPGYELAQQLAKSNAAVPAAGANPVPSEKQPQPDKDDALYTTLRDNLREEALSTIKQINNFNFPAVTKQSKHRTQGENLKIMTELNKKLSKYNELFNQSIDTIRKNSLADEVDQKITALKEDLSIQHKKMWLAADELNVTQPERLSWKEKAGSAMETICLISLVAGFVAFLASFAIPLLAFIGTCCLIFGFCFLGQGKALSDEGEKDRLQLNELYQQYTEIRQNLSPFS